MAYNPRYGSSPGEDNTGRILNYDYAEPAYIATLPLNPNAYETVRLVSLTGAQTINLTVTRAKVGDKLILILLADGTGRTVTLGTGFAYTAATIAVTASKKAIATFIFDGVAYVEVSRAITV
jgi:hypothetical protein